MKRKPLLVYVDACDLFSIVWTKIKQRKKKIKTKAVDPGKHINKLRDCGVIVFTSNYAIYELIVNRKSF